VPEGLEEGGARQRPLGKGHAPSADGQTTTPAREVNSRGAPDAALLVGVGFGLNPGYRAARLDPLEALGHE
jgi:hypothetical protein